MKVNFRLGLTCKIDTCGEVRPFYFLGKFKQGVART